MAKRPPSAASPTLEAVDRLIDFERSLADDTREFADGIEALTGEHVESLYQAERSMLAAVDSLSAGKYENASLQERDALKYLIEARNKLVIALTKSNNQALRNFDRTQAQKLRRPKDKDEEAEQVVERLRQLAKEEEFIYATLAASSTAGANPSDSASEGATQPDAATSERAEQSADRQGSSQGQAPRGSQAEQQSQGEGGEQGANRSPEGGKQPIDREALEKLQREIADESRDIERIVKGMKDLSPLAQSRMSEATQKADDALGALVRGNTNQATDATGEAAEMFDELARHVEGMIAREMAQRVAMARDLASELADRGKELSEDIPGGGQATPENPSSAASGQSGTSKTGESNSGQAAGAETGSSTSGSRGRGQRGRGQHGTGDSHAPQQPELARLLESGRTLEDWLKALAQMERGGNPEATKQIREIVEEGSVTVVVKRIDRIAGYFVAGRWNDAQMEAHEIAERLEAVAQRLDTLYRGIVTPRLEELMAVERRAAELDVALGTLDSEMRITEWHHDAEQLLRDLNGILAGNPAGDDLLAAMRDAGWGSWAGGSWHWAWRDGHYVAPALYYRGVRAIIEELQSQTQELLLSDLVAARDEAIPPEYKELVERYYKVLSADVRKK